MSKLRQVTLNYAVMVTVETTLSDKELKEQAHHEVLPPDHRTREGYTIVDTEVLPPEVGCSTDIS